MTNICTKFLLAKRFTFDPNSNSLTDQQSSSEIVRLGSNESRILLMLVERPNEVLTRSELHEFVWREQGFEVDDSSLTQAISTLRKMLKDSTKSPEFVKTVPKRGYQLICSVERINPLSSGAIEQEEQKLDEETHSVSELVLTEDSPVQTTTDTPNLESTPQPERQHKVSTAHAAHFSAASNKWLPYFLLLLAALLPVSVFLFTHPAESQFRQIGNYDNVLVKTPINHPQLDSWLPSIKQCVESYVRHHKKDSMPVEVIATGGQRNQLVLNYIHDSQHSYENVTLRIFSGQNDPAEICQ